MEKVKKNLNLIGVIILIILFILFYLITTFCLDRRNLSKNAITPEEETTETIEDNYDKEKEIIDNLYQKVRILYDVVNNKYKVDHEDTITDGDIIYKKITNFEEVTNDLFTSNGLQKYITDLGSYFIYNEDNYYLAGNLVTYQTYYFRGDDTKIFVIDSSEKEINGIIYETWTSSKRSTLATIKIVSENEKWLIEDISILSSNK